MTSSSNAAQFIHDVRVASSKPIPGFDAFINYSMEIGDQKLINAILSMPESCLSSPEECAKYLNQEFFSKTKTKGKWTDMVTSRRNEQSRGRKRTSRQKAQPKSAEHHL